MDFSLLQDLLSKAGQNIDDSSALQKKVQGQTMDQVNAALRGEGPVLPPATPEQQKYYQDGIAAVAGSVAPGGKFLRAAPDTAKEAMARGVLNATVDTGMEMPAVQKAAQQLGREVDFAARARAQRFEKLQKMLGRN